MDERDPQTGDGKERVKDSEVEAHRYKHDRTTSSESEEPGEETPDVEAHRIKPPDRVKND